MRLQFHNEVESLRGEREFKVTVIVEIELEKALLMSHD